MRYLLGTSVGKVLSAFALSSIFAAAALAENAKGAEHWLERMARFYERAPFAMDYSILVQVDQGGDTSILSAGGAITYGDETHMRMAMKMTALASGQESREVYLLLVADGETAWTEIEGPTEGVQVVKMPVEQFQRLMAGPGGLDPGNPLAQVRRLQELVDFEVAEEGGERVVLRAPVSDRLRQEAGPRGELLGPDARVMVSLDPETGAPLRMEIADESLRMQMTFENLRFLDPAVLTDGTFAYQPPEGANVAQPAGTRSEEPETIRCTGYIDATGKVVIEPLYQTYSDFSEGLAIVQIPGFERMGAIDTTGKMVIEPRFRWLGSFSEGLATARRKAGDNGYVDVSGEWVIEPRFDSARTFSEGLALVRIEGEQAWIDRTGEVVIGPRPYRLADSFSEGVAAFQTDDQLWGLIDRNGTVLVEPRFRRIRDAADGMVAVQEGDSWGFVDVTGRMVIEPRWDAVIDFGEGLAPVGRRGRGWSYVDRSGKVVIEGPFELAFPFREGLGAVKLSGGWGFIDPAGEFVIEPRYAQAAWFTEGLAVVEVDGKMGYVDPSGELVIEPRFESAEPFSEGLARFGVTVPLSPLHSEVIREAKWADEELFGLAFKEERRDDYEREISRLEEELERLVPAEPGIEEFIAKLRRGAERSEVGLEVERLGEVDHPHAVESRLKLDLTGSDEAIDLFLERAGYVRLLTAWHEPRQIEPGSWTVEISIYSGKPPEIPALRTCARYSHRLDASASPIERRAVDALEALCDELDTLDELRGLEGRAEALQSHLEAMIELYQETRRDRPAIFDEDISDEEMELIEKVLSDGEE